MELLISEEIYSGIMTKEMSKTEWLTDFIVRPGIIQLADYMNDASAYYLVESGGKQLLVNVSADLTGGAIF